MSTPSGVRVDAGAIVALRLYDVAYAIDLPSVEAVAAEQVAGVVARIRLQKAEAKAISFGVSPLEIGMGSSELHLDGGARTADVSARVYDFGAVSLALRFPVADVSWEELVGTAGAIDRMAGAEATLWTELLERLLRLIAPALQRPSAPGLEEDYLLTFVQRTVPALDAAALTSRVDLAALLSGETRRLSEASRRELLRHSYSYYEDDLVVLTWDHAFLLEPSGDTDVADVLEVANAQLLELRYYDELLDDELPRMYQRVNEARRAFRGLSRRRYSNLAKELYGVVAEVTEITERVDNALKVTEDVYLARIYAAALELFRVRGAAAAVDRKLGIIRDTYTALYDEAATARAEILEAAIVLLIVIDIVLALLL